MLAQQREDVTAGNRARVTSMATVYSTTRPLVLRRDGIQLVLTQKYSLLSDTREVGHASSSLHQGRLGYMTLLQQPPWPNGQGVGLLIRRLRVRVPQGVLGDSKALPIQMRSASSSCLRNSRQQDLASAA